MLTFVEDSVWDRTNNTYTCNIIPHHFSKVVTAKHRVEFYDEGGSRMNRLTQQTLVIALTCVALMICAGPEGVPPWT